MTSTIKYMTRVNILKLAVNLISSAVTTPVLLCIVDILYLEFLSSRYRTPLVIKMVEELQKKLQKELDSFRACQKERQKAVTTRQQLDAQLNENDAVKNELDLMPKDGEVYKLIGPVLIKHDLGEAKHNVTKRMDYIKGELKRLDEGIEGIEKRQETHWEALTNLQKQLQQATVKAAMKA